LPSLLLFFPGRGALSLLAMGNKLLLGVFDGRFPSSIVLYTFFLEEALPRTPLPFPPLSLRCRLPAKNSLPSLHSTNIFTFFSDNSHPFVGVERSWGSSFSKWPRCDFLPFTDIGTVAPLIVRGQGVNGPFFCTVFYQFSSFMIAGPWSLDDREIGGFRATTKDYFTIALASKLCLSFRENLEFVLSLPKRRAPSRRRRPLLDTLLTSKSPSFFFFQSAQLFSCPREEDQPSLSLNLEEKIRGA